MRTVELGDTGQRVSAMCLGAMYFGTRNDAATSYQLLDQYIEAGGRFIDTANIYAHWAPGGKGGESERLLGRWMRERGNREQIFLATKVGFDYPGIEIGASAAQIERECEKSLRRLGVETIDLYYIHKDDRTTPLEETLAALDRLHRAGKIRYVGASNFLTWRLERARWVSRVLGWTQFCCIQQRYTYLRPRPGADFGRQVAVSDELRDYCRHEPVTLLAYSALLSGAYVRDDREIPEAYRGPDTDARLKALHAVAEEVGATPNQVILAWMLAHDVIPLVAASRPTHLAENLNALEVSLGAAQLERLDEASA
jgi:aryl-alcohol dehydrogenase-like predicted oxidoreductase